MVHEPLVDAESVHGVRAAHLLHDRSAWESSSSGWWRVEGTRRIMPFAGTERFPGGNRVTMDGACWAGIDRRRHLPSSSSLTRVAPNTI